ncbi:hypothetical protein EZS27_026341 [termite gut metagenome]|uniref:THIF-type NAD/FAD binding fold domain-containing protein n=1 Tax=termite gut metagenome TaxID=433724 RepID=A0A5J4QQT5_9ZZZZ
MAQNIYSKQLNVYTGELSREIQQSIQDIKILLNKRKVDVLEWGKNHIAITILLNVELPPRGNYHNIDIREREPVLIVFNKISYPHEAPRAYADRLDFPKKELAHLYISKDGKPAPFCLIRGDLDEWFAEKEIRDYVFQVKSWLCDAASGELATDGNQYEPLRLEGYSGTCVYKYKEVTDYINNKCKTSDTNFVLGLFYETQPLSEKTSPSFKFLGFVESSDDISKIAAKHQQILFTEEKSISKWYYGIICWDINLSIRKEYLVDLPENYGELSQFITNLNINIVTGLEAYFRYNISKERKNFPLIVAIKRPKNIIGYDSDIEFVNFTLFVSQEELDNETLNADSKVVFQKHIEPLSIAKALEVSGNKNNLGSLIIAGCGALGSKVIMHLIRSGYTNMLLLDGDSFSAHNLVRHSLFPEQVGKNKAMALKNVAESFYKYDNLDDLLALPIDADILTEPTLLDEADWFLDFTASKSFLNHQIRTIKETSANICKATILDSGKLGVLLIEGKNRNPRLDDLLVLSYDLYKQYHFISKFLQDNYERNEQDSAIINVGVGCNSETTILSDEIVSIHSATFCSVIKNEYNRKSFQDDGYIFINRIDTENGFKIESFSFVIKPLISAMLPNGWEIRMKPEVALKMKSEMGIAMPGETGGIFIGLINKKNKTIHVTDLIFAPNDSESNEIRFYRGINGLPEEIDEIKKLSGQTFGYIGEWHSHPFGPNGLSPQDMKEVYIHLKELRTLPNPMPLFIMVITPNGLIPFVYE